MLPKNRTFRVCIVDLFPTIFINRKNKKNTLTRGISGSTESKGEYLQCYSKGQLVEHTEMKVITYELIYMVISLPPVLPQIFLT